MMKNKYRYLFLTLLVAAAVGVASFQHPERVIAQTDNLGDGQPDTQTVSTSANSTIYLPLVFKPKIEIPLMTGIYPQGWPGIATINNEMKPLDQWVSGVSGGRSTTIFGTFLTFLLDTQEAMDANVSKPLTEVWNAGYVPFINLETPVTAAEMASGAYEVNLRLFARSIQKYANNGERFVYFAPLQEMNGGWVVYGRDPANYIATFKRLRDIFNQEGVPSQSVKWVFAPNGWTHPNLPMFEDYYPGDAFVDVVAISAYNFGYCSGGIWEVPSTVYNNPEFEDGFYLDRLRAMAPTKPIFIAQTGSTSFRWPNTSTYEAKDQWLDEAYQYLSNQPHVKAVLYYNKNNGCDWAVHIPGVLAFGGYRTGVNSNGYSYISPAQLIQIDHELP